MKITPTLTSNTSNPGIVPFAFANNVDAFRAFDDNNATAWVISGSATAVASFRYWRMDSFVSNASDWWSVSEFQLGDGSQVPYTSSSWTTVTLSRYTDDWDGSPLIKLVDGQLNNWINLFSSNAPSFWIQWEFPSSVPVAFVRQGGWYDARYTNSLRLLGSDDGNAWTIVYSGSIDRLFGANMQVNNYAAWTSVAPPIVLSIDFSAPVNAFDSYVLRSGNASIAPTTYFFEGYPIDNVGWVTLDTQTNLTGWVTDSPRTFNLTPNFKAYSAFRIRFPSIPSGGVNISEFSVYRTDAIIDAPLNNGDMLIGDIVANLDNPPIETLRQLTFNADIPVPDSSGGVVVTRPVQGQLYPRGIPNIT